MRVDRRVGIADAVDQLHGPVLGLPRLLELAERDQRPGQQSAGEDAGNAGPAETREFELTAQTVDDRRVEIRRFAERADGVQQIGPVEAGGQAQHEIIQFVGEPDRLLGRTQPRFMLAGQPQRARKLARRRRQPALVAQRARQRIGFAHDGDQPVDLAQRQQRTVDVHARIDGQRGRGVGRQPIEHLQRPVIEGNRLVIGRTANRLRQRSDEVVGGLVPHLAALGVRGQQGRSALGRRAVLAVRDERAPRRAGAAFRC